MKKLSTFLLFLIPLFSFSQDTYTFRSGGQIFQNDKKITPDQIRTLLINDQKTLEIYEAGRTKKTFGNLLLYGGLVTLASKLVIDLTTDTENTVTYGGSNSINIDQKRSSKVGYILGGAMLIASIPIKKGYSKKIKKAVSLMNEKTPKSQTSLINSSSIMISGNGVGVCVRF